MNKKLKYSSILLVFALLLILASGLTAAADIDNDNTDISDNSITDTVGESVSSTPQPTDNSMETKSIKEADNDDTYTTTASEAKELAKDEKNLKTKMNTGTLTATPDNGYVGDNVTLYLKAGTSDLIQSLSYSITVKFNDKQVYSGSGKPSSRGNAYLTIPVPNLEPGEYTVTMKWGYSNDFIGATGSTPFTILNGAVDTKITAVGTINGEIDNTILPINITDSNGNALEGSPMINIKDGDTALVENYTVTNGVANVSVPTTRTGDYDLTVEVIETPFFNSCNATIPVSISKAQTTLTVDQYDEGIYEVINALNNTLLTGTLVQTSNSKALGNKEITVTVEGSDYTVTTDNEGKFIYKYDVTQLAEGLSISIKYNGDELYQASQEYSGTFDIEALDTTIILDEDPLSEVNETTTISGKLTDNYNNPIPNTDVKLEITGVNDIVTVTTDSEGKFSYDVIYNDVLEVTVEASLANAVLYEAEPATMTFNVVVGPKRTNLTIETGSGSGNNINIVDVTPYFNEVITNGTLIDIFKEPVADATIKILINNEDYSQTTDSEGKFTLVYNATQGLTTYNISVEFEGNDAYKPAGEVYTGTFKTEAFDITVTVDENFPEEILIGDEITITGTATLQNQTLKNNEIVLTIGGTKFTTATDEEGKYSYTYTVVKNGNIPVIANATFSNADIKVGQTSFFVAKPDVNIDLDEIADTKVYSDVTLNGRIYIAQNDTPIEDSLILKINGNSYDLSSDEDGNFNYVFTPSQAGTYEISISYANVRYNAHNISFQVTAIQRQAQLVNDKLAVAVKVNDLFSITGLLTDETNTPVSNAEVIFIINNEEYSNVTDENGRYEYNYQATKTGVNNQYEVKYSGDNNYVYAKNYVGSFFDVEAAKADLTLYVTDTSVNKKTIISGTVSDKNENFLSNVNLIIDVKNSQLQTKTDDTGMFNVEYTPTKTGQTTVTVTVKDDNYLEESETTTFNVDKETTITTISPVKVNENLEADLTAIVTDSDNNPLTSGKTVFKINGKTVKDENGKVIYSKISNGQASLAYTFTQDDINNNVSISAVFSGSSNYVSSSSQKVTIITAEDHDITITLDDITATQGESITITAVVKDYDENVNTGKIVFKINGKTIKDENNKVIYSPVENGIASCEYPIPETMKTRTYNLTAVFTASQYNRTEANAQLTVEAAENNGTNPTGTVHIITNDNIDQYITKNGLTSLVSAGDTLDIQGTIDKQNSLVINKPVNVISSTKDAVISLHTNAGSYLGEDPGNCFVVNKAGSGSNVSNLYLYNTECWMYNNYDVTLYNMTMYVQDARVGSGVGQTAIRYCERFTMDSCVVYTENNGGSTSIALTGTSDALIKNTTIQGVGNVGNILYLANSYNMNDQPSGFTIRNTNITVDGCMLIGECNAAINYAMMNNAKDCKLINTTVHTAGQYGYLDTGTNGIAIGNKMYGASGLVVRAGCDAYDNVFYGTGKLTAYERSRIYNNTIKTIAVSGLNVLVENNTIDSVELKSTSATYMVNNSVISNNNITGNIKSEGLSSKRANSNVTIKGNIIGGSITLSQTITHTIENNTISGSISIPSSAADTLVRYNTIITSNQYAITNAIASSVIINNYLVSNNNGLLGNAAVSDTSRKATIANNTPNDAFYTHVTFEDVTGTVGENINIAIIVSNENGENTDGEIYLKVNDEILTNEDGNTITLEVSNGMAMLDNYIIPTEWLKSDTILTAVYTNGAYTITESTSMNIEKMDAFVEITTEDLTATAGSQITLTARVTDNNGELINGQLAFKLDGNTLEDNDEKLIFVNVIDGIATYEYTIPGDMQTGSYTLTAVFENTYYQRCDDVKTLIIE
ncbi:hypothetical protein [Methanosphaera sp. BMS]|uniref:hypothetical protein n=1 Tax=Methanosphaera sp. BMS TaxID=1789762 RepID=UPI000DC1D39B|nr:hypothetical protein [Methanosphaera sp. BMS]AWX32271.1 hypothetical protein AW729_03745 [Methanosphaera sp. BMS]